MTVCGACCGLHCLLCKILAFGSSCGEKQMRILCSWDHGCRSNVRALRCLTSERFATCNGSIMGVWFVLHCLCMLEGPFCCFPAETLFHCRIISTFAVSHPLLSDFFLFPFWKKAIGI